MVRSQPLHPIVEQLWIAGDSPISRAVARLAGAVDFQVAIFPHPQDVVGNTVFSGIPPAPTAAVVLLESIDEQVKVLSHWINFPLVFLGVSASRDRRAEILDRLRPVTAGREQIERIQCPIGLSIGASTVEEGAISIIAHLIQNRSDRRISHEAALRIKSPSLIKARA